MDALIAEHAEWVRSVAARMHRRRPFADLEDVQQCAMIALWRAAMRYDKRVNPNFRGYAWMAIRGEIIRALNGVKQVSGLDDHPSWEFAEWAAVHDIAQRRRRALTAALRFAGLTDSEGEVIQLLMLHELESAEVAQRMGRSKGWVWGRRLSGLRKLREWMERRGVSPEDVGL